VLIEQRRAANDDPSRMEAYTSPGIARLLESLNGSQMPRMSPLLASDGGCGRQSPGSSSLDSDVLQASYYVAPLLADDSYVLVIHGSTASRAWTQARANCSQERKMLQ
jgi:hypothetical protein